MRNEDANEDALRRRSSSYTYTREKARERALERSRP